MYEDVADQLPVAAWPSDGEEEDPDDVRKVQAQGGDGEARGNGEHLAAEGEGDNPAEDTGPSKGDSANPPPPHRGHQNQRPHSPASSTQPGPAAEVRAAPALHGSGFSSQSPLQAHSPHDIMTKPWADKFSFLESLSKDGKYRDLLQEINQMFLSHVSLFASSLTYMVEP